MLNTYLQVAKKSLNLHLTIHAGWFRIDSSLGPAAFWVLVRWPPLPFLNNRISIQSFFLDQCFRSPPRKTTVVITPHQTNYTPEGSDGSPLIMRSIGSPNEKHVISSYLCSSLQNSRFHSSTSTIALLWRFFNRTSNLESHRLNNQVRSAHIFSSFLRDTTEVDIILMTTDLKHIVAGQQENNSAMSSVLLFKVIFFFVSASPTKSANLTYSRCTNRILLLR